MDYFYLFYWFIFLFFDRRFVQNKSSELLLIFKIV